MQSGEIFEALVLNEICANLQTREVNYWRDRSRREVDLIVPIKGGPPIAIEYKWSVSEFNPAAKKAFRTLHPGQRNFLVADDGAERSEIEVSDNAGTVLRLKLFGREWAAR